jgi:hypothetical protein
MLWFGLSSTLQLASAMVNIMHVHTMGCIIYDRWIRSGIEIFGALVPLVVVMAQWICAMI